MELARKTLSNGNRFKVTGGLHYIKGNSAPYFSLTYEETTARGRFEACGAGHVEILQRFPRFANLAALHLSDINGAPMHTLENGLYHLGGTRWQGPDFGAVARHFRISEDKARDLAKMIFREWYSPTVGNLSGSEKNARVRLWMWIEGQRARWKGEAMACIAEHDLKLYGDKWSAS